MVLFQYAREQVSKFGSTVTAHLASKAGSVCVILIGFALKLSKRVPAELRYPGNLLQIHAI